MFFPVIWGRGKQSAYRKDGIRGLDRKNPVNCNAISGEIGVARREAARKKKKKKKKKKKHPTQNKTKTTHKKKKQRKQSRPKKNQILEATLR